MTVTSNITEDEQDVVVAPEVQAMEEGTNNEEASYVYPVAATAVIAEPVPTDYSLTTHALTGSNRFIPVAVASALPDDPSASEQSQESDDELSIRPDLLSATVYKASQDSPVGIAVMDNTNVGVTVKRIDPDGLFASSSFQVGDRVMSVNSESCEGLDSKGVADLIRKAERIVSVVVRAPRGRADRVSSMVMKESPDARLGIGFQRRHGKLAISSINEYGIFAHSLLNVSDMCLSINGVPCTSDMDATSAVEAIRASPSFVTITAKTQHETGVVVAVSQEEPDQNGAYNTDIGVNASTIPVSATAADSSRIHEGRTTAAQKKLCLYGIISVVIIFLIIVFIFVSGNDDDYNYPSSNDIVCNVCGRHCYNGTTFQDDYCCVEQYVYSYTGSCDSECTNVTCPYCLQRLNDTTFEIEYECVEESTTLCGYYSTCPCTYKLCDNVCEYNCWNETTLEYDYCCKPDYVYTCYDSCPYGDGSAPVAPVPAPASFTTPISAPFPSPSVPVP